MSSRFITESEALEARKKRQEEWERVRTASDPVERPEDPFDSRSLFDRLQEQKQKKDLEYEEAHKLKNMIKGLDDDEIDFLELVDRTKQAADKKKSLEEEKELSDYRNRVATLQEEEMDQKIHSNMLASNKSNLKGKSQSNSQVKLLKGAIKTKAVKHKLEEDNKTENKDCSMSQLVNRDSSNNVPVSDEKYPNSNLKCIGILPGLGHYEDSSSEETSDSDFEVETKMPKYDLAGRKIEEPVVKEQA